MVVFGGWRCCCRGLCRGVGVGRVFVVVVAFDVRGGGGGGDGDGRGGVGVAGWVSHLNGGGGGVFVGGTCSSSV